MKVLCLYEQATGLFVIDTPLPFRAVGYAGRGNGRNNPAMQAVRSVGPLPCGDYRIGLAFNHERLGPLCFRLTPDPANNMFGRSAFLIHGDNTRGDASEGCIILARPVREILAKMKQRGEIEMLRVVKMLPVKGASRATVSAPRSGVDLISVAQVTPARGHQQ